MALGSSSISAIRDSVGHIISAQARIMQAADSFQYVMSNDDFLKFAADTKFGTESQDKMKKALTGFNKLNDTVQNLKSRTDAYCDQQETLNNSSF